jgi:hypothetical protein
MILLAVCSVLLSGAAACSDGDGESAAATSGIDTTLAGPTVALTADLTPDAVVPEPGPATASGTAELTLDPAANQICGVFELTGVDEPLNIFVQQAPAGRRGPLIARFTLDRDDLTSPIEACGPLEPGRGDVVAMDPGAAYVQIDSREAPGGALRGQLERADDG